MVFFVLFLILVVRLLFLLLWGGGGGGRGGTCLNLTANAREENKRSVPVHLSGRYSYILNIHTTHC